jgi:SAM-dependent methyltransferase
MKLNLGCGAHVVDGWINVDYSPGARLSSMPFFRVMNRKLRLFELDWDDRIYLHDLTMPFPWKDATADVAYSSHTLEHLSKKQGCAFLRECYRVLKRDGIIRIIVPDLAPIVKAYCDKRLRADDMLERLGVLYGQSNNLLKTVLIPHIQFPHKCMYDTSSLLSVLSDVGFQASSRKPYESEIVDIDKIEIKGRTDDAVIVEGRK